MPPHTFESPAKKQSKWSSQEDSLIIELRGSGMKWDDISKRLPGRSSISCRLHYQNYLERRSEWDEERKNKLARLYERFKPEMWAKVAEEMQVPWRAAEAMHWQLGEAEMARRAGVVPFSLNVASNEPQGSMAQRISPTRGGHAHSQSQGSLPRDFSGLPSPRYTRGPPGPGPPPHQIPPLIPPPTPTSAGSRPLSSRRESLPRGPFGPPLSDAAEYGYGLAPIQTGGPSFGHSRGSISSGGGLPGVAELTTGISPYSTPAYAQGGPPPPPTPSHPYHPHHSQPPPHQHHHQYQHHPSTATSPIHSSVTASPGPGSSGGGGGGGGLLPALSPNPHLDPAPGPGGKRRASPPDHRLGSRETSRRRQHLYSSSSAAGRDRHGHGHGPPRDEYPPPPPLPAPPQPQHQPTSGFEMGPGPGPGLGMGMGAAVGARRAGRHGF
ncbi:hypothetical protein B0I37DRAFT_162463 [Chaetomium sp. MPI-CAGE-AT-0009]|nr:hypothetical protein B0I37DRAFT_162463 [Chaetomium sp. MPI-CAGE-AT-0009]